MERKPRPGRGQRGHVGGRLRSVLKETGAVDGRRAGEGQTQVGVL